MPQIKFVDISDAKWRRTGGDKIYVREGKAIVRRKGAPSVTKSSSLQKVQQLMRAIAADYKTLSPAQKVAWDSYKTYTPEGRSAWNAMFANNMRGQYPNVACISEILNISSPATPPHDPIGFTANYFEANDSIRITWTDDYSERTYIQAFEWIAPGRERAFNIPWRYVDTVLSPIKQITVPASRLVAGSTSKLFIRALNLRGEVSSKVQRVDAVVPDPPLTGFCGLPLAGMAPLSVQFCEQATGVVFSRLWHFGDGGTSVEKHPQHIYTTGPDKFSVRQTVYGAAQSQATLLKPEYISTSAPAPYPYKYTVQIDNTGNANALTDYQVKLTIPANSDAYDHAQADGGNIRFYAADDSTALSYWMESWSYNGVSIFWVKVPSVPASDTINVRLHAIQPTASTTSSKQDTFYFHDDFPGPSLDATKWSEDAVGNIDHTINNYFRFEDGTKSGNIYYIYNGTDSGNQHQAKWTPVTDFKVEWTNLIVSNTALEMGEGFIGAVAADDTLIIAAGHQDSAKSTVRISKGAIAADATQSFTLVPSPNTADFTLCRSGDDYKVYMDDVLILSYTASKAISKIALMCGTYGPYPYVNYIQVTGLLIRGYADPEPTAALT